LTELIDLWHMINKQIVTVLSNSSEDDLQRTCRTDPLHTIEWLAQDYIKHMKHHLHQVLDLPAIAYP